VALLLAVWAVFGQTIHHEFVNFDDDLYIRHNPLVVHGLTLHTVGQAFSDSHGSAWIPLTWISHTIDWELFGNHPGGHHLTNVFLHAAAAVLLFLALWRMTGDIWPSALAAALFAIHPLRAESVAWVTERKGLLSGLCFMLTLLAYTQYTRHRFSAWRYALVVIAFALGLLAKPMLVTVPLVLLLLDYWPLGRLRGGGKRERGEGKGERNSKDKETKKQGDDEIPLPAAPRSSLSLLVSSSLALPSPLSPLRFSPRVIWEKIPLLVLAACDGWMTLSVQGTPLASNQAFSLWWRIGSALVSYVNYLKHFFCPWGLALEPRERLPLSPWAIAVAAAILIGITVMAVTPVGQTFLSALRRRGKTEHSCLSDRNVCPASNSVRAWIRRRPYLLVGWLWYLIMLLPVVGVLQFGIGNAADRFTYLPQIGLCVALVWGGFDLCRAWPRRLRIYASAAAMAVLLILGGDAWCQTYFWHDSVTLWSHSVDCTSGNWLARNNLGNALIARGDWQQALEQFRKALAIDHDNLEARVDAASMLAVLGHADEAAIEYRKALQTPAPGSAKTFVALGDFLLAQRQFDAALSYYRGALKIDPHFAPAYDRIGKIFAQRGRDAQAISEYEKSLMLDPDSVEAMNDSAWLRATSSDASLRNAAEAIELARRADGLSGRQRADVLDTLAAAYAEAGRFAEAVATARRALNLAQQQQEPSLANLLQKRIASYEAEIPLRQVGPSSDIRRQWRPQH
jgi:tetratricopeptide (TPR) repeat protein